MSIKELQEYTRISKYARYNQENKRRETWDEQINRVMGMHNIKYADIIGITKELEMAEYAMKKKLVLGSQRALQFGGRAILEKNARLYNCCASYADRVRFFQESMWLLLCGCGVGFSVQKHHIDRLPSLQHKELEEKTIVIEDSIEGWADAVGQLLSSYFTGEVPFPDCKNKKIVFDYSLIRDAGSIIKSSGGKAPGPDGLRKAIEKIRVLLDNLLLKGQNKLKPINAYDILMHVSDAVLSGGVRRSATICMFSLDDDEMMTAKTGNWFDTNPQRARSNNSVVLIRDQVTYKDFKEIIEKVKEFGEPGFVWSDDLEFLVNPCFTKDTWITTSEGARQIKDLIGKPFTAYIDGKKFKSTDKGFFKTGTKKVYELTTNEGFSVTCTDNHKFLTNNNGKRVWKELKDLSKEDKIVIHNHKNISWEGGGTEKEGWLIGNLIGDGCFSKKTVCLDFWGKSRKSMVDSVIDAIYESNLNTYQTITGCGDLYGITKGNKTITDEVEKTSSDFYKGIIRGLFDADGSVQGNHKKGISVRLTNTDKNLIQRIHRMLARLGIYSKIYWNRGNGNRRLLPDGKGGAKYYDTKYIHEIIISRSSIKKYTEVIGFKDEAKSIKLNKLISLYKRPLYTTKYIATVKDIKLVGVEDVYDCTIPKKHAFDANGFYAHNCVEIGLYAHDTNGVSGWAFCNLCEMNVKKAKNREQFLDMCKYAAILGTFQAGYTSFSYLGPVTESIVQRESLLGVSMTGMMDNPDISFDPELQKEGARIIRKTNEELAAKLGINPAARTTCVKPAGSTSCILGTASGIHPHHANRYFRRVQANKMEEPLKYFRQINPHAVEESVWSTNNTDDVITFVCEVPPSARTKVNTEGIKLLEYVKLTQKNWISAGKNKERCAKEWLNHNVSNTIHVKDDEWEEVSKYIYQNRKYFTGISILPIDGDKDYPQAPFTTVYTPNEIVKDYGDGSLMASGLIVDGLRAFDDDLWAGCDYILGIGEKLDVPDFHSKRLETKWKREVNYDEKLDWHRRGIQFSDRYFNGDKRKMTYCLKDVYNWKLFCDLKREYKPVDWENFHEQQDNTKVSETIACAGGKCDL